jgi:hypothetical protein
MFLAAAWAAALVSTVFRPPNICVKTGMLAVYIGLVMVFFSLRVVKGC